MPRENAVATKYWHKLENGKIQCDVCPRACQLQEGQRGMCFVRGRVNDAIALLTYGRSSGFCIDPIEKKPLNHFFPGSAVLSFGTAGCNLACKFCQNWDISKSREMETLADQALPEQIAQAARQFGCKSVAFTYNDPVVFMEYAIDVAQACREQGVQAVAVTAGYICAEPRQEFFRCIDAANVDLKGFTEEFYKRNCAGQLGAVLDTLQYLHHETDVWLEITTLLIPGENDSAQEIERLCCWVAGNLGSDVPLHFTAFHADYKMLDKGATSPSSLSAARAIALKDGLRYVYTGNVHDESGASTYCHGCGAKIIGRDWYTITAYDLTDAGCCRFCQTPCAGRFQGPAGSWGAKRQPVSMRSLDRPR